MTKTSTVASKAFVAIVAAAMVFSLVAPAAKAATAEELQAQITALMAQIAALSGTTTTAPAAGTYTFTRSLTIGAQGADVTALQTYLISKGFAIPAGATGYFGAQSASAVAAWQTANMISPAAGYFGPVSQAKYMSLMAAVVVPPVVPPTGTTTTGSTTAPVTLSGEASLDKFEVDSASDDTVDEGAEEAEIGVFTVKFADGDAEISRLDVALTNNGDAWDAFESVQLMVDGKVIAEVDASSKDDYLGDEDDGILRFSDLKIVAMEDEELEITVSATMQSNLDGTELGAWTIGASSLRFFDADAVATTETGTLVTGDTDTFTIQVAGFDDEMLLKTSTNDPDATTLKVEDNSKSDEYNVFTFDIDTKDSTNDIDVSEVTVTVLTTVASYNALVDDAELVIDGVVIDDVTVGTGSTTIGLTTLTFDVSEDVTIDAGDRVEAKLMLTFKSLALANEGATVKASVTAVNGEGAETVNSTGTVVGDEHTLRTSGISSELDTVSSVVTVVEAAGVNDYATYKVSVDVTAFEQDVYISTNPATSTVYALENGASVPAVLGSRTPTLSSTGEENAGFFEINEGETETITLEVTYIPGAANTVARLALTSIVFNDAPSMVTPQTWAASPATTYRTGTVTIVN